MCIFHNVDRYTPTEEECQYELRLLVRSYHPQHLTRQRIRHSEPRPELVTGDPSAGRLAVLGVELPGSLDQLREQPWPLVQDDRGPSWDGRPRPGDRPMQRSQELGGDFAPPDEQH